MSDSEVVLRNQLYEQLKEAVKAGNIGMVRAILDLKPDLKLLDMPTFGDCILAIACGSGNLEMVKILVTEYGAFINKVGWSGSSPPLVKAVSCGHYDIVRFLLSQEKTNIDIRNGYGCWSPLSIAIARENVEMIQLLLDYGARIFAKDKYDDKYPWKEAKEHHPDFLWLLQNEIRRRAIARIWCRS